MRRLSSDDDSVSRSSPCSDWDHRQQHAPAEPDHRRHRACLRGAVLVLPLPDVGAPAWWWARLEPAAATQAPGGITSLGLPRRQARSNGGSTAVVGLLTAAFPSRGPSNHRPAGVGAGQAVHYASRGHESEARREPVEGGQQKAHGPGTLPSGARRAAPTGRIICRLRLRFPWPSSVAPPDTPRRR